MKTHTKIKDIPNTKFSFFTHTTHPYIYIHTHKLNHPNTQGPIYINKPPTLQDMNQEMKMGNEYKYKYNPHHHYSFQQRRTTTTSTFLLPMLCRLSIKDVKIKRCKDGSNNEPSSSSSSPKVSCIGQVKRRNSKIHVGIPSPHKHTKLKRFFSGKNVINTTREGENSCDDLGVNISELDPPLPVVKKVGGGGEVSLWSRRSGGDSFKTLHIHLPPNNSYPIIPPTTV